MEHIVTSQIHRHLETYNILHPNQHGFRKGLSCGTQLISTLQDWTLSSADAKRQTDVVLLNFSKAFDKVSHRKLLWKVDFYGIGGKTKAWIAAFLAHRTQNVLVNGKASSVTNVLSTVPHPPRNTRHAPGRHTSRRTISA